MNTEELAAFADTMHKHGVRRLKIGDVEIEAGEAPAPKAKFNLEEEKKDEAAEKQRADRLVYGGSR
jgi:hypothetical protein